MKAARHGDAPPPENRNEGGAMQPRTNALAERIYQQIKQAIFDFEFLPGDRFTEQEIAARFGVSRTPVRDALYRLEREGYLQVAFRSGWHVRPLDFRRFGELYDVRVLLEVAAVAQLCQTGDPSVLEPQREIWCVPPGERLRDGPRVHALDEAFHAALVATTGNREMARIHHEITEKIRIVRRLDFTSARRIEITYDEHAKILDLIRERRTVEATIAIRAHIENSKAEVRKITLHMLHEARERLSRGAAAEPLPADDGTILLVAGAAR